MGREELHGIWGQQGVTFRLFSTVHGGKGPSEEVTFGQRSE